MPLSEFRQRLVEKKLAKYCSGRIPEPSRHQVKLTYKIRGNSVTLIEERPYFKDPSTWSQSPIAQGLQIKICNPIIVFGGP